MKTKDINYGMDFPGVIFFILLTLKLFKLIDISWWWVTAPLWIPWGIIILILLIFFIFYNK